MTLAAQWVIAVLAAFFLVVIAALAPDAAARGWLIAFGLASAIPLGALALLLIHRLTGGAWGEAAQASLARAAATLPAVAIWFVILLLVAPWVYPWVRHADAAGPGVGAVYLNLPEFALRGLALILGLAFVARRLPQDTSRLEAGLALAFYAIGMNFVAFDWLLSLAPRYTSSAFGAQIILAQLCGALALTLCAGGLTHAPRAHGDIAALLLACLLGEGYLILMTLIVHWYGDLPEQAAWFLRRTEGGWRWFEIFGVLVGLALPLLLLLFERTRTSPLLSAIAGGLVLCGLFFEMVWLVAPPVGAGAALAGAIALVLIVSLTPDLARGLHRLARKVPSEGLRHGL